MIIFYLTYLEVVYDVISMIYSKIWVFCVRRSW